MNEPGDNGQETVKEIVADIVQMQYRGDMQAIACVIVDRDGDLRTLMAYGQGAKMPLIAGIAILQHETIGKLQAVDKARDD